MPCFPAVVEAARENRQFLARAVTWTANQGIGQFIDLGCGMPTAPNTHESAQAIRPDARVVYVDSDPVAVSRLREVAVKGSPGLTAVDGDVGVTALFDGTELVSPGVVDARQWHPGWSDLPALPFRTGQATCGVGRIG